MGRSSGDFPSLPEEKRIMHRRAEDCAAIAVLMKLEHEKATAQNSAFSSGRVVILHFLIVAAAISVLVLTWQQWKSIKKFNQVNELTNEILTNIHQTIKSQRGAR